MGVCEDFHIKFDGQIIERTEAHAVEIVIKQSSTTLPCGRPKLYSSGLEDVPLVGGRGFSSIV